MAGALRFGQCVAVCELINVIDGGIFISGRRECFGEVTALDQLGRWPVHVELIPEPGRRPLRVQASYDRVRAI